MIIFIIYLYNSFSITAGVREKNKNIITGQKWSFGAEFQFSLSLNFVLNFLLTLMIK